MDTVQKKVTYRYEAGNVFRADEYGEIRVGSYNHERKLLQLVDAHKSYRPAVVRFLNNNDMPQERVVIEGSTESVSSQAIPRMPKKHPKFGDKTPALVEWYEEYRPEEFKARYGVRGPKMADGKWPAERQTHRTAKVNDQMDESDEDWNADVSGVEQ
jgi:hypothetical protein